MPKNFFASLRSNPTPHFDMANGILPHFYKSLTGETKVVG
jgi:hypothetical protein